MKCKLFIVVAMLGVLSWTILGVSLAAKAKKKPETLPEDDLSDTKHFDHGKHDSKYDHDAFLGEEDAATYDSLTPEQTKEKLKKLIPHIDVNRDKKISRQELFDWIETHMKKHFMTTTQKRIKEMDKNKDGKVTHAEYEAAEYAHVQPEEKDADPDFEKHLKEMKDRDRKRFEHADMNSDGSLTKEELDMMLHPEEYPHMAAWTVQDNLDMYDTNKDGVVSLDEYFGMSSTTEKIDEDLKKDLTESFNNELDKNKDGVLDRDEVKKWIMPDEHDPTKSEVTHLMNEADDNKDNFLSEKEILHNHDLFAGSRATRYGEMLREKGDEL